MRWPTILTLLAMLGGCTHHYVPPAEGTAVIVAHPPDALLSEGIMEVLIFPEGCPIMSTDEALLVGRVGSEPVALEVEGDHPIVLQVHFQRGNVSCRAHMDVRLEAGKRYEMRSDLKRLKREWNDFLDEYLCSFTIVGVRSIGMVKPGGHGKPEC